VIDAQTQMLLQETVRREQRSLLQYLAEAFPWTTPGGEAVVAAIGRMSVESQEAVVKITRFLLRNHVELSYLGAFAMDYTNSNFIGLDYALVQLVDEEHYTAAFLEGQLPSLTEGKGKELLENLLAVKKAHLREMETLAGAAPATTVR
jgi:hypothetical protein